MFVILHEIKESSKTSINSIVIEDMKEITVNISEARVISSGNIFDKDQLKNFQYFNPEKVSGISTIIKFENFEIVVAEDYKYIYSLLK